MSHKIALLLILLYGLMIWWSTKYLPLWGDAEAFVNTSANHLLATNFRPLIAIGSDFAHPPLWPAALALIKLIPGSFLYHAHLAMLPFILIYLYSVYFLVQKWTLPLVALCAVFVLGFIPLVSAELANLNLDLPSAALAILAVCLYLTGWNLTAFVIFCAAVLTKETALLFWPFFLISPPRAKLFYWVPLPYIIWLIYHSAVTGWWLFSPQSRIVNRYVQSPWELINVFSKIFSVTFVDQYRFLLFLPFAFGVYLYIYKRRLFPRTVTQIMRGFLFTFTFFLLFYLLATEYLSRYLLLILPVIMIIAFILPYLYLRQRLSPNKANLLLVIFTVITCFGFSLSWYPHREQTRAFEFRPPSDLLYLDHIRLFTQAGAYLATVYPDTNLIGSYPENFYFTDPTAGYIATPFPFTDCAQINHPNLNRSLLIIHPYSPGQASCQNLLNSLPHQLVGSFQSGSLWLDIYNFAASPSVQGIK